VTAIAYIGPPRNVEEYQISDGRYIVTYDGVIDGDLIQIAMLVTEDAANNVEISEAESETTPRGSNGSRSRIEGDKRAVSGPAQTVAVAAAPCRMAGHGTVRRPEDGQRSVRRVSFLFGRFPLGCFEGS
jgi:hypothetical protein